MMRIIKLLSLLILVGAPLGAQSFMGAPRIPCFSLDARTYYALATGGHADHVVWISDDGASADIRIHLIDAPESADFVMVS